MHFHRVSILESRTENPCVGGSIPPLGTIIAIINTSINISVILMQKTVLLLILFLISFNSYAYLGPGMGGGVIAAIIGFFAAIILGLWAILYYPIKRALRKRKNASQLKNNDSE